MKTDFQTVVSYMRLNMLLYGDFSRNWYPYHPVTIGVGILTLLQVTTKLKSSCIKEAIFLPSQILFPAFLTYVGISLDGSEYFS